MDGFVKGGKKFKTTPGVVAHQSLERAATSKRLRNCCCKIEELKSQISSFIKIRVVGAELLHSDGRT